MFLDLFITSAHFIFAFSFVALLALEWVLIKPGVVDLQLRLVARIDLSYGLLAAALVAAGTSRVLYGAKDASFYIDSPFFWIKMALFVGVGLASIPPTVAIIGWRRAAKADAVFRVPLRSIKLVRRWLMVETLLLLFVPLAASLMARGYGL